MAIARIEYFPDHVRVGCLRVWDRDDAQYGDKYDWACTAVHDKELDRVSLYGVDNLHTRDQHRAVFEMMRQNQIKFLGYDRITNDRVRHVIRDIQRGR